MRREAIPFRGSGQHWALVLVVLLLKINLCRSADSWATLVHDPGYCATYGICGHRQDGDVLSCPSNTQAQWLSQAGQQKLQTVCPQLAAEVGPHGGVCCTEEQLDKLQQQIQTASIFLVGCPACNHNFKHFYCLLTCSPDQATFTNVTAVQAAFDNNATAVKELEAYVSASFGRAFFDSCKDVVYAPANQRAMTFVGGGASTFQEWFDFLGLVKDKRFPPAGSPFQMDFPPEDRVPQGMRPMNGTLPSCGDTAYACSCGDCPAAPGCEPPPPPPSPSPGGCPALGTTSLTCPDISLLALYVGLLALIPLLLRAAVEPPWGGYHGQLDGYEWLHPGPGGVVEVQGGAGNGAFPGGTSGWSKDGDGSPGSNGGAPSSVLVEYSAGEEALRAWFYRQGVWCARRPVLTLTLCLLCVGACALGVVRLRVMTSPQELWVGRGSQAARDKADYESSFGPFYRITQLILSTTPRASSPFTTPSGLPAIVTDAHIQLLFDMQDQIDALTAVVDTGAEAQEGDTRAQTHPGPGQGGSAAQTWSHNPAAPADQQPGSIAPQSGFTTAATSGSRGSGGHGEGGRGRVGMGRREVRLADVCLKPLGGACATQSLLQYWSMSREVYQEGAPPSYTPLSPDFCFSHWSTQCRAAFGGPIDPHLVLGGFPTTAQEFRNYSADASAFVVTFPLVSRPEDRAAVEAWELAFLHLASTRLAAMAEGAGLELSFSTERSVQDELGRESAADVSTVLLSYLAMLLYIAVALGTFPRQPPPTWTHYLVYSRAGLGLGGVVIVGASVAGALGVCGWCGVPATLIIMEVIPFLVLAVGVDNMFILAHALDQHPPSRHAPLPHRMGLALAGVGPSITLAAACEVVAFAAGTMTSMPALRNFSLCAALAVALDFLLQVTAFVSLLALDTQRVEAGRYDCMPWRRSPSRPLYDSGGDDADEQEELEGGGGGGWQDVHHGFGFAAHPSPDDDRMGVSCFLKRYMSRTHAPFLMRPRTKAAVLAGFLGMFLLSCALLPRLQRGLDQSVALPRDSHLQRYYSDVMRFLRVGPPVMLVVRGMDVSRSARDVDAVCSVAGCDTNSMLNQVSSASRTPWSSWLATPAASWLDDFLTWVSPDIPQCCRKFSNGTRCPPPDQAPCSPDPATDPCQECTPCFQPGELEGGRPTLDQFRHTLPWFLASPPSQACAKGGAGVYIDAIQLNASDPSGVAGLAQGQVAASAFRANYVVLAKQSDFINALQAIRDLVGRLRSRLGLDVYSYSVFHIFFEQYLTIGGEALVLLGSAAVAVFVICLVGTGSIWASSLTLLVLCMMLVDMMGVMCLGGVQLNAVSLVNLVMSVGIGVEFCAHVIHAFMEEEGTPDARAAAALGDVGAAVLSGITITKLLGVSVLMFAHTRIFEVYYFRMYLALVLLGATHGLVLLPVLLSVVGPDSLEHWALRVRSSRGEAEGGAQEGAAQREAELQGGGGGRAGVEDEGGSGRERAKPGGEAGDGGGAGQGMVELEG